MPIRVIHHDKGKKNLNTERDCVILETQKACYTDR